MFSQNRSLLERMVEEFKTREKDLSQDILEIDYVSIATKYASNKPRQEILKSFAIEYAEWRQRQIDATGAVVKTWDRVSNLNEGTTSVTGMYLVTQAVIGIVPILSIPLVAIPIVALGAGAGYLIDHSIGGAAVGGFLGGVVAVGAWYKLTSLTKEMAKGISAVSPDDAKMIDQGLQFLAPNILPRYVTPGLPNYKTQLAQLMDRTVRQLDHAGGF